MSSAYFRSAPPSNVITRMTDNSPISNVRFLDNLIGEYRQKHMIQIDQIEGSENIHKEFMDTAADDQTPSLSDGMFVDLAFTITDTVRNKKELKARKTKDDDKFVFNRAVSTYQQVSSFLDLRLTKPILKALTDLGLDKPTPIQCACIPVGLLGHDVSACARTGSGKTMAFLLPILDRLVKRPAGARPITRALIISPTRELALQLFRVAESLIAYCTKIRIQLAAGGLDLHSQEANLRQCPDMVIATPGRLIDHLSNSPNFNLSQVEYLVLDEADKLLDEYFVEQIGEIIKHCSRKHQTLLFSATMTESVKELAVLSLQDPVQIFLNQTTALASRLHQEFLRIRPQHESDRPALLTALLIRSFKRQRVIVFFATKKQCHRMYVVMGLLGVACAELHGDMNQAQRMDALARFSTTSVNHQGQQPQTDSQPSTNQINVLLATDLAARGLDISGVEVVINFTMPRTMKQYVHRVGRTARASATGRAVSLVGENERKLLKQIVKEAPYPVQSRTIAPSVVASYCQRLTSLDPIVNELLESELEEKELRKVEAGLGRLEHQLAGKCPTSVVDVEADGRRRRRPRKDGRSNEWFEASNSSQRRSKFRKMRP